MKALSLTRPWGWIILNLGKRIENRTWPTSYRGPVLLHSSKTMSTVNWRSAYEFVFEHIGENAANSIPKPKDPRLVKSAIIGIAELCGVIPPEELRRPSDPSLPISQWPWYMGAYGFLLRNVKPTNVVPCNGTHKLWTPSIDIVNRALEGIKWPGTIQP